MKMKILVLAMSSGLVAASCCKTYQCKDDRTGIITGEVCATSQAKANSMCNYTPSNPQTAIKK